MRQLIAPILALALLCGLIVLVEVLVPRDPLTYVAPGSPTP